MPIIIQLKMRNRVRSKTLEILHSIKNNNSLIWKRKLLNAREKERKNTEVHNLAKENFWRCKLAKKEKRKKRNEINIKFLLVCPQEKSNFNKGTFLRSKLNEKNKNLFHFFKFAAMRRKRKKKVNKKKKSNDTQ